MGEYANGVVYKITTSDFIYVGSTKDLKERKRTHNSALHNEKSKSHNLKVYQAIRANNYHWEMEIIKYFPCESKAELDAEEQRFIDELKPELNCINSHTDTDSVEHREKTKEKKKQYYQAHKEERLENYKQYRQAHKEEISECQRKYRQSHKEELNKYSCEKIECDCGCIVRRCNMARHKKTQRHLDCEQHIVKKPYDSSEKIECECGCKVTRNHIERHKKSKKHLDLMNQKNT
tara:strand:+ start:531 stop:1232 length:702 start_codon:yes stop_codon:yes gene_type:complete